MRLRVSKIHERILKVNPKIRIYAIYFFVVAFLILSCYLKFKILSVLEVIKMSTGPRIKERRKQLGMSADQLAEKIGVSRSTVFRYENGYIEKVPLDHLGVLSAALCTTPEYLMGWTENPSPKDSVVLFKEEDLTPFEREVLAMLRRLSPDQQQAFLSLLKTLPDAPAP
jgi:transcriptional regulator with XRE-family HTH domain